MPDDAVTRAKKIKCIALDVDGTMTDGSVNISESGELFKRFDIKDGLGIAIWQQAGGETAIITGRESGAVLRRASELRINHVYQGAIDKRIALHKLAKKLGLDESEIAYVGDDLIDLAVMRQSGLAVAVSDAAEEVKKISHYITKKSGGNGAIREAVEFILKAQNRWDGLVKKFFEE